MAKKGASSSEKAVAKYLQRQAEPEAAAAEGIPGDFGHAVVVPAYAEGDALFSMLGSVPSGPAGNVLIVLVLNSRADSSEAARRANDAVRDRLARELPAPGVIGGDAPLLAYPLEHGRLVLVDRSQPGRYLPEGQGVGLARKIGCDIVLALHATGRVGSPWIHATDADTILPGDYFDQTKKLDPEETGAAIYSFEHRFDAEPALASAGRLYEISLRYYVLGLAWAGSPYAYESMGSCLAIPAASYAMVRGFPKRNALEDFHALNKLAKVGTIQRLGGSPVILEGRVSDRVPISTGQAISGLAEKKGALDGFSLYHPAVFAHLAAWLRVLSAIARSKGDMQAALAELPEHNPFFRTDVLQSALEKLDAFQAVREAISLSSDSQALLRHLHTWFDALRTQRLIHALRDGGLPSLGWLQALDEAPFTGLTSSTEDDPETLRRHLAAEEKKLAEFPAGLPSLALPTSSARFCRDPATPWGQVYIIH